MRLGLISDVHANLHALDAAIDALQVQGVDGWLCAGDLVGYGAFPNECVHRIAELGAVTVAGNHDLIALEKLSDAQCIPLARNSLRWTRDTLRDDTRHFLERLPLNAEVAGHLVMAHGSLDDPQEYVTRDEQAATQLRLLADRYPRSRALILGHTHRPRLHTISGHLADLKGAVSLSIPGGVCVNPGSVGQSRERTAIARFAMLDLERGTANYLQANYDTAACRAALQRHSLPTGSCHLAPNILSRCKATMVKAGRLLRGN